MPLEATPNRQPGADPDVKEGEVAVNITKSPRDVAIEAIEARQDEARMAQIEKDAEGDPGAQALAARMQAAQDEARHAAIEAGQLPPDADPPPAQLQDGTQSVEPMHEPQKLPDALPTDTDPNALPAELQDDPLAEHIVMYEGKPMFALKVNGENQLMPLDAAKRQLQIGVAAEIRMQSAVEAEKRAKQLLADAERVQPTVGETAAQQRVDAAAAAAPPVTRNPGIDEEDIRKRARDVMITAFTGTEADAGDKLTKLLMDIRTPLPATAATPINEDAIVEKAATAAVQQVTAVSEKRDLVSGYTQFQDEYPEIMADVNLYRMADGMTDEIEAEHPEWSKSQVMLEAGSRTRKWIEDLKGTTVTPDPEPVVTPKDETISEPAPPPNTLPRQERKRTLVQIPPAASSAQPSPEPEERPQTPQEALDEVRRVRGQAV